MKEASLDFKHNNPVIIQHMSIVMLNEGMNEKSRLSAQNPRLENEIMKCLPIFSCAKRS